MSIQNVNIARFARNVECDFFGDFQTLWIKGTFFYMSQNLFVHTLSIQGWEIVSHLKHSCEGTHHISSLYYKMCNVVSCKKVKVYQMHSLIWICTGCPGKFWIHFSAIFQRTQKLSKVSFQQTKWTTFLYLVRTF